ncbi:MAG: thiamine pyrophosphate-dependent dehydrogenase E1 component subunit alpha [Armatimonadetes bacterium]|nr:thiamine pyrophosphate-dependent dehydrogenase E1 component subunit alpha [Armatimonadota bacterium]
MTIEAPPSDLDLSGEAYALASEEILFLYEMMTLVRRLDERMLGLQRQGRIGFYGACTGQEAAVIGSAFALKKKDWVFPGLREGAAMLLRGFPLSLYLCQIFGNEGDLLKGRQMPCHYSDRSVNQVSWGSCVGTQIPQAAGAAWGMKFGKELSHESRESPIVMCYFGEGATSEADFHVGANFAGVFNLPVVFFCQNNQWSISVSRDRQTASPTIAQKALAYGFPGVQMDGNDIFEVYRVTRAAVERARRGNPTLLEALTYRMGAHTSSDDPRLYRDPQEAEEWAKRDPISMCRKRLESQGIWSQKEQDSLETRISDQISRALRKAEGRPSPPGKTLFQDVFAEMPWHLREQMALLEGTDNACV